MKKLRFIFVFVLLLQIPAIAFSQGKYGKDSAECVKYLGFYKEPLKQNNIDEAAPLWREALKYCPPSSSHDMLYNGIRILKYYLDKPNVTPQRKKELTDSIMLMYDRRIEYHPKYLLGAQINKVFDMNDLGFDDLSVYNEGKKAIALAGETTETRLLVIILQKAISLYQAKKLPADSVLNFYTSASSLIADQEKSDNPKIAEIVDKEGKKVMETLFANSGVANCENIVAIYTPTFEANKSSKAYINNLVALLQGAGCVKEELFAKAVESLNVLDPSYKTASFLAMYYRAKEDDNTALKYLQEALNSPDIKPEEAGENWLSIAQIQLKFNNYVKAIDAVRQAAQNNPSLTGKSYMLMSAVWASLKCGGNEIDSRAHFWVAYDYLMKAKNADSSLAEEADKLMVTYRQYFPLKEEAFMNDLLDGTSYTVSCGGLRESTTVRTRKE
jgi:hypothetical protein